jgi:hypothetical protein
MTNAAYVRVLRAPIGVPLVEHDHAIAASGRASDRRDGARRAAPNRWYAVSA